MQYLRSKMPALVDALSHRLNQVQQSVAEGLFDSIEGGVGTQQTVVDTATCRNIYNGVTQSPVNIVEQQIHYWQSKNTQRAG